MTICGGALFGSSMYDDYTTLTVRLPSRLVERVDHLIDEGPYGYKSRAEVVKDGIRRILHASDFLGETKATG